MDTRRLLAALVAALGLVPGCASLPFRLPFMGPQGLSPGFTQEDLELELGGYAGSFSSVVGSTADQITQEAAQRLVRKRALIWRLRMIPAVQTTAFEPDAQHAYLDTLTLAVMQRQYLESGDGRALFAAQQPLAVGAARDLEQRALDIGTRFLTRAELTRVRLAVDALAKRYPIQGTDFSLLRASGARQAAPSSDVLSSVLSLPLAPFHALEGVDTGAAAIQEFNQTARRFASIVQQLPDQVRGQAQLLLYDVEDRDTVVQGLAAFESLAASADRASASLEQLPVSLQQTLDGSKGTVAEARQTVEQARALAPALSQTAASLQQASAAWLAILGPHQPPGAAPAERPFDLQQWEDALRVLGTTAGQLRGLAEDLDRLSASGAVGPALDRAFWHAAALMGLFFALLLAYRVLAARLARPPPPRV
jgi:hypothetical protein